VRQDVVLDGLVEELLESRGHMLDALVQFDEEVGIAPLDLAVRVQMPAQLL